MALRVVGSSPITHPIFFQRLFIYAFVAQLDRASDFGSEGWGFDSLRAYHPFGYALIAQLDRATAF